MYITACGAPLFFDSWTVTELFVAIPTSNESVFRMKHRRLPSGGAATVSLFIAFGHRNLALVIEAAAAP